MERILIQLGRIGDIINILPLAEEFERNSKRLTLMVAQEFAPLLEGVSYCDALPFAGDYKRLVPAEQLAATLSTRVRTSQCWAEDYQHTRTSECFQKDAWGRLNFSHRFDRATLIFDKRSPSREQSLLVTSPKRIILYSLVSHSSPFNGSPLIEYLTQILGDFFLFVDISQLKAEKFFDLLGLFDEAEALITVDTASLHLAGASSVPVLALVNPSPWLASARRANHLLRVAYDKLDFLAVANALRKLLTPVGELRHVYSDYAHAPADTVRIGLAKMSWESEYNTNNWNAFPCLTPGRSSKKLLGEQRDVPYIKDLIEYGFKNSKANDCVVLTNSDVGFTPGMSVPLRRLLSVKGACFCYRRDFDPPLLKLPSRYEVYGSKYYGGLDFFAFSKAWWLSYRFDAPDMLLGCTHWDLVYRDFVKKHGGGELYAGVWHEAHPSYWKEHPEGSGNKHNLELVNKWRAENDAAKIYDNL